LEVEEIWRTTGDGNKQHNYEEEEANSICTCSIRDNTLEENARKENGDEERKKDIARR